MNTRLIFRSALVISLGAMQMACFGMETKISRTVRKTEEIKSDSGVGENKTSSDAALPLSEVDKKVQQDLDATKKAEQKLAKQASRKAKELKNKAKGVCKDIKGHVKTTASKVVKFGKDHGKSMLVGFAVGYALKEVADKWSYIKATFKKLANKKTAISAGAIIAIATAIAFLKEVKDNKGNSELLANAISRFVQVKAESLVNWIKANPTDIIAGSVCAVLGWLSQEYVVEPTADRVKARVKRAYAQYRAEQAARPKIVIKR